MGFRPYRGPVNTVEQAVFTDMPLRITCQGCAHFEIIHSFRLMQRSRKAAAMSLWRPVSGFYCKGCRRKMAVVITAPLQRV
jgi:hypothetical protein